jgi:hypothetical protein
MFRGNTQNSNLFFEVVFPQITLYALGPGLGGVYRRVPDPDPEKGESKN